MTETEDDFVKSRREALAIRSIEDVLLRTILEYEEINMAPFTSTLLEVGLARCEYGWTRLVPDTRLGLALFVGRRLQHLQLTKLIKPARREPGTPRGWVLTDDGRFEARKLRKSEAATLS